MVASERAAGSGERGGTAKDEEGTEEKRKNGKQGLGQVKKSWAIPPHRGMALCKRGLACECKLNRAPMHKFSPA